MDKLTSEALKFVAPLAVEAGASIEETAAATGVLANNGLKGTVAGTALARAYKNLSTTGAQKKLKAIGVEAVNSAGDLRPLATILAELGRATQDFGSAKKLALFEALFGRGSAAALKLAGAGATFDNLQKALDNAGGTAGSRFTNRSRNRSSRHGLARRHLPWPGALTAVNLMAP